MIHLHSNEENHLKVKIGVYPAVDSVVLVSLFPLLESGQIIHSVVGDKVTGLLGYKSWL